MLAPYKKAFIDFALSQGVLRFGEFMLKSGRTSPYFFNAGEFKSGHALKKLGDYYAEALIDSDLDPACLFGPAYKGIPLVSATAIALAANHNRDLPYAFNRKEAKDHGEGGLLVGAELKGRVVIIDDVITAGTAIREVMTMLEGTAAEPVGVVVAIDRQERGQGELSAIQEVERDYQIKTVSVVDLDDIVQYLEEDGGYEPELKAIGSYRSQFGIASKV